MSIKDKAKAYMSGLIELRSDSWMNSLTGMGTARDKRTAAEFVYQQHDLDALEKTYLQDDIAAKGVDKIVQESFRKGFEFLVRDEEDESRGMEVSRAVMNRYTELQADAHQKKNHVYGRLLGSSLLFVLADDGLDPVEPLNLQNIRRIHGLRLLDRRDMDIAKYYNDPLNPKHGLAELYRIQVFNQRPNTQSFGEANPLKATVGPVDKQTLEPTTELGSLIHESRLIRVDGIELSNREMIKRSGWGASILERPRDLIRDFASNYSSVAHLMIDAPQGVFKIQGLIDMIIGNQKEALNTRMEIVDRSRSVARALLLDADNEDFDRQPYPMAHFADVLEAFALRLATAFDMPLQVFMGKPPSGINANDDSGMELWRNNIEVYQNDRVRPGLEYLLRLIMLEKEGPTNGVEPTDWELSFRQLEELNEKEVVEMRKTQAETDAIYINAGVYSDIEVAKSRFSVSGWTPETSIDLELRDELEELDKDSALERARLPEGDSDGDEGQPPSADT